MMRTENYLFTLLVCGLYRFRYFAELEKKFFLRSRISQRSVIEGFEFISAQTKAHKGRGKIESVRADDAVKGSALLAVNVTAHFTFIG